LWGCLAEVPLQMIVCNSGDELSFLPARIKLSVLQALHITYERGQVIYKVMQQSLDSLIHVKRKHTNNELQLEKEKQRATELLYQPDSDESCNADKRREVDDNIERMKNDVAVSLQKARDSLAATQRVFRENKAIVEQDVQRIVDKEAYEVSSHINRILGHHFETNYNVHTLACHKYFGPYWRNSVFSILREHHYCLCTLSLYVVGSVCDCAIEFVTRAQFHNVAKNFLENPLKFKKTCVYWILSEHEGQYQLDSAVLEHSHGVASINVFAAYPSLYELEEDLTTRLIITYIPKSSMNPKNCTMDMLGHVYQTLGSTFDEELLVQIHKQLCNLSPPEDDPFVPLQKFLRRMKFIESSLSVSIYADTNFEAIKKLCVELVAREVNTQIQTLIGTLFPKSIDSITLVWLYDHFTARSDPISEKIVKSLEQHHRIGANQLRTLRAYKILIDRTLFLVWSLFLGSGPDNEKSSDIVDIVKRIYQLVSGVAEFTSDDAGSVLLKKSIPLAELFNLVSQVLGLCNITDSFLKEKLLHIFNCPEFDALIVKENSKPASPASPMNKSVHPLAAKLTSLGDEIKKLSDFNLCATFNTLENLVRNSDIELPEHKLMYRKLLDAVKEYRKRQLDSQKMPRELEFLQTEFNFPRAKFDYVTQADKSARSKTIINDLSKTMELPSILNLVIPVLESQIKYKYYLRLISTLQGSKTSESLLKPFQPVVTYKLTSDFARVPMHNNLYPLIKLVYSDFVQFRFKQLTDYALFVCNFNFLKSQKDLYPSRSGYLPCYHKSLSALYTRVPELWKLLEFSHPVDGITLAPPTLLPSDVMLLLKPSHSSEVIQLLLMENDCSLQGQALPNTRILADREFPEIDTIKLFDTLEGLHRTVAAQKPLHMDHKDYIPLQFCCSVLLLVGLITKLKY